jgi:DNA-directed RNA polymerase subunit beta
MEAKFQKKKYERGLSRRLFSKSKVVFPEHSLLSLQKDSYYSFIGDHKNEGRLSLALKKFFPLRNSAQTVELNFIGCRLGECRYSIDDCLKKELTYSAPIFATFQILATVNEKQVVREQEMYMGEMPIMTDGGSFVVNGVERVIVSQIHRSPGVIFGHDSARGHSSGRKLYYSKIIPYRGSWLDFEFDYKGIMHSKIDKKRKLPSTTILLALNGLVSKDDLKRIGVKEEVLESISYTNTSKKNVKEVEDRVELDRSCLLRIFYHVKEVKLSEKGVSLSNDLSHIRGYTFDSDVVDTETNSALFHKGYVVDQPTIDRIKKDFSILNVSHDFVLGGAIVDNIIDNETGEVLFAAGHIISQGVLDVLFSKGIFDISVILPQEINIYPYVLDTMNYDKNANSVEALFDIYRAVRPGDTPSPEGARTFFQGLFFDSYKYDLSPVGRVRMNERLGLDLPETENVLTPSDIFASVFKLIEIKNGNGYVDDIDSLLCRRVRSVGELFENQCYISFSRVERSMIDMINSADPATVMPSDLVGVRFLDAPLKDCVLLNQLSQFMDQTNPLSEISHKRRISALGPGALSRERSGFEVRDVNPTQYGRICPIETPEGSNLGIVSSLSLYARVNKYGFIETPYYVVKNGIVTDEIVYLSASQEIGHKIAQYTDKVENKIRSDKFVTVRCDGKYISIPANEVTLCDVSAAQAFSVATAMIALMEQDEAHRALMGANMQRQAVPLVTPDAPLVGTGWEGYVARESGAAIVAKSNGVVVRVDSHVICVQPDDSCNLEIYHLRKFAKSNAGTCVNQRPVVLVGDVVKKGDILSDGPCVQNGEIALGKDVKVAFLSFFGKNFEDSVVVSEKIAAEYTSVHLMEVVCKVMDSKGVTEDISRSIPNVNPEKISHLDEFGLPCIGSKVSAGDILVGKISRNIYDYRMSPEDKLLRSIFGDVALNVKDVSSKVPIGVKMLQLWMCRF